LLLDQTRLVTDANDQVTLCQCHRVGWFQVNVGAV
jgi:hypothetical protein